MGRRNLQVIRCVRGVPRIPGQGQGRLGSAGKIKECYDWLLYRVLLDPYCTLVL
jgi:hypothetical protein